MSYPPGQKRRRSTPMFRHCLAGSSGARVIRYHFPPVTAASVLNCARFRSMALPGPSATPADPCQALYQFLASTPEVGAGAWHVFCTTHGAPRAATSASTRYQREHRPPHRAHGARTPDPGRDILGHTSALDGCVL